MGAPYENNSDIKTNGELRLLKEVAAEIDIAFDVGANIGDWCGLLWSLNPTISHIYAFEPCSSAFAKLKDRSFAPSVVSLFNMGLSSQPGKSTLYVFGEASGVNSLHNRHGLEDGWGIEPAQSTEDIRLETIDIFCEKNSIHAVDFIKVDTEGHEVDVLEGAVCCLGKGSIKRIQFEYGGTYIDSRKLLKDVFKLFAPFDYTIFLIVPTHLIVCPRYDQRLENFQYKNFIIFHNSVIERTPSAFQALQKRQ